MEAERRQTTVLFTDMVGFTSFSERSGEEAAFALTRSLSKFMDEAMRQQGLVAAGAADVVAMRYSVYVVTAAQFLAEPYGALARCRSLGEAVTWARKNLHDQPERRIAYPARPLSGLVGAGGVGARAAARLAAKA